MPVNPIPEGFHTVTPYLIVEKAVDALAYYQRAFDAVETLRLAGPSGKVAHAEIRIGDSLVCLADEFPELGYCGPKTRGGTPVTLLVYVEDVDARFRQAIDAGAVERRPLQDQFYGDRTGTLEDPFGHVWTFATHIEDLTQEELDKRYEAYQQKER